MAEYKYVDLPTRKASGGDIPDAVSQELNELLAAGWEVSDMIDSRVIGKVGFLLKR